jgi:glucose/arabinose dehydrogenase
MTVARLIPGFVIAASFAAGSALADVPPAPEPPAPPPTPGPVQVVETGYKVTEIAKGLDHPYSIAFLPDGSMLVTERKGQLRLIKDGQLVAAPITGVPPVHSKAGSQAGLFDVVLHPKFAENSLVYLTYAHGTASANMTRVARARFDGSTLQDLQVVFEAKPPKDTSNHYGGRLVFLPDGTFTLLVGDGFEYREQAQNLGSHLGKIVRLNEDGTIPQDNPFAGREGVRPETYSLGHRNQQGLVFDAERSLLFETEHGPQGGDELNVIAAGKNYGWPVITYGRDYTGAFVSPFTERPGMEQPLVYWTPSIAPSGLAVYRGDKFPAWNGDLLVGALAFKHLRRVDLDDAGRVVGQEQLLTKFAERIRDVRVSPDGYIYVTTDYAADEGSTGRVLKLEPAP